MQRQSAETRLAHHCDIHEYGGCGYEQISVLDQHHRMAFVVAALFAWSHSVTPLQATIASSSVNPTEMMTTYKAPLPVEQWDAI